MASNYPTSLDNFTNPTVSDYLNSTTVPHATQHSDLNDAVENLQAKVGIDSSADTDSIDYKVADAASRITTLEAGATADAVVAYADLSARTAANPSPSEGDVSWQEDTNRFDIYDGSAWSQVAVGGEATAFTPSWNNFTVGDAVESWYYTQINDLVVVTGITTLGSTSAVTGTWSMNYPIGSPNVVGPFGGNILMVDATGDNPVGMVLIGGSTASFRYLRQPGTYVIYGTVNATSPFTWTVDDQVRVTFVYQLS